MRLMTYSEAMCMRACISWAPTMRMLGDIFLDDRGGSWGLRVYYLGSWDLESGSYLSYYIPASASEYAGVD